MQIYIGHILPKQFKRATFAPCFYIIDFRLQQQMNQANFDEEVTQSTSKQISRLLRQPNEPTRQDLIYLTPKNAIKFERAMNKLRFKFDIDGFILQPIRERHQIQYKQGLAPIRHFNFEDQENFADLTFDQSEKSIRRKIPKNIFMCFLLIQLIRKNSTAHFFIYLPDQIYMKFTDYRSIIHKPLDIFTIVYKIFRGEYANADMFVKDMVTMIQNAKIYFAHHPDILVNAILFETLFWQLYEVEIPKYAKALAEYRKEKMFVSVQKRASNTLKKYDREEKLKLQAIIKDQKLHVRAKIFEYLQENAPQCILKSNSISLAQIPSKFLREVESMCELIAGEAIEEERYYHAQQILTTLKATNFSADDIYEQSDDD